MQIPKNIVITEYIRFIEEFICRSKKNIPIAKIRKNLIRAKIIG